MILVTDKKLMALTTLERKPNYDESRPDGNKENQAGQPGPVEKQKEKENTCDKSTATGMLSNMSTVHG